MSDTSTVSVEVTGLFPLQGRGKLIAWAMVELTIDGVAMVLQGVTVMRRRDGMAEVVLPCCRALDGDLVPAVALPEELELAVMRAVLAEVAPGSMPVPARSEACR